MPTNPNTAEPQKPRLRWFPFTKGFWIMMAWAFLVTLATYIIILLLPTS